jgi:hypothetical protein
LKLQDPIRRKRPGQLTRDNARPHTVRATQERIQELQWELLAHPPYSPDLAPSDFHLFGSLKNHLGGRGFGDDEEVETDVQKWRRQQSEDFCAAGKAMGQVYQCWWTICREINVFFQVRISLVSRFIAICDLFTDPPSYLLLPPPICGLDLHCAFVLHCLRLHYLEASHQSSAWHTAAITINFDSYFAG